MKKTWKIVCALLFFMIGIMTFGKTEVHADYIFNSFESEMKVGTEQVKFGTIYWIENNTQKSSDVDAATELTSSNEAAVKAWIARKDSYGSGLYSVNLKAVGPGTSTITIHFGDGNVYQFSITTISHEQGKIDFAKKDITINKGESYKPEQSVVSISWGNSRRTLSLEDLIVTSSNKKIVKVEYNWLFDDYLSDIEMKAVGAGTATITVEIQSTDPETKDLNGMKNTFKITVVEGKKAAKPKIKSQTTFKPQVWSDQIVCGFELLPGNIEYEIWASPYKNKGFKKVAWAKAETFDGESYYVTKSGDKYSTHYDRGDTVTVYAKKYNKKKFNTNKKYYFKIRARYMDSYHSSSWSSWSATKEYWTSPAKIKNSKVKFSKKTQKVTFPKVRGIKGYTYHASNTEKLGYNIYGKPVYFSVTERRTTSKRTFIVPKLKYKKKAERIYSVWPYAKHGKYYYIEGEKPVTSLKKFRYWNTSKYAGKN